MDNVNYVLYVCTALPFLLALLIVEGRSRWLMLYLIIGSTVCICVSEINYLILTAYGGDFVRVTIMATPITEEIIKALPVLYYALFISDNRKTLLTISFATGVGFAVLENSMILYQNIEEISLLWAFGRGFGSSLMHGLCTGIIGIGISYVKKKRKLFAVGTIAMLLMAITYHSTYNVLVQSQYRIAGLLLPVITYIPIMVLMIRHQIVTYNKMIAEHEKRKEKKDDGAS
ncbi:MAG: PrsW family intramembrane metalloprotease [Lachnospiraceae bacterium]|nr:PrsW family intramembrane metalloprotease [Lachnospiraceae bacterium]